MAGTSPAMTWEGWEIPSTASSDTAFEADGEQLLRLDREFHRQFLDQPASLPHALLLGDPPDQRQQPPYSVLQPAHSFFHGIHTCLETGKTVL
jgi:hypothetical protein